MDVRPKSSFDLEFSVEGLHCVALEHPRKLQGRGMTTLAAGDKQPLQFPDMEELCLEKGHPDP